MAEQEQSKKKKDPSKIPNLRTNWGFALPFEAKNVQILIELVVIVQK